MGIKLGEITLQNLISTSQSLREVIEEMENTATAMQQIEMPTIPLPWVQVQWDAIDDVVTLGNQIKLRAKSEILAFSQNRHSKGQKAMARTEREREAKAKQRNEGTVAPPKPRGRPRKKA